jgi:AAA family ATPase
VSPHVNIETQLAVSCRISAVLASISLLLTAGLEAGQRACIFPYSGIASTKQYPRLPSLREVQEVGTIRLKELCIDHNTLPSQAIKGLRRDWLTLAARELLGMFFVSPSFLTFSYHI